MLNKRDLGMTIKLTNEQRHNLYYNLRDVISAKIKKVRKLIWHGLFNDQEICRFMNVSNVTFSRQMNSNKLDSAFLHKYLISAGIIPESVTEPIYDSLEAFISLYPDQYQKQIKSFFEKN